MIYSGMRSLDNPFWDGNLFSQFTMYCTSYLVINFVKFLYGMEWKPHLTRSLIVHMDCSMSLMCSFAAHVCRCAGNKNIGFFKFIIAMEISDSELPVLVLGLNMFYTRYYLLFASTAACLY